MHTGVHAPRLRHTSAIFAPRKRARKLRVKTRANPPSTTGKCTHPPLRGRWRPLPPNDSRGMEWSPAWDGNPVVEGGLEKLGQ